MCIVYCKKVRNRKGVVKLYSVRDSWFHKQVIRFWGRGRGNQVSISGVARHMSQPCTFSEDVLLFSLNICLKGASAVCTDFISSSQRVLHEVGNPEPALGDAIDHHKLFLMFI